MHLCNEYMFVINWIQSDATVLFTLILRYWYTSSCCFFCCMPTSNIYGNIDKIVPSQKPMLEIWKLLMSISPFTRIALPICHPAVGNSWILALGHMYFDFLLVFALLHCNNWRSRRFSEFRKDWLYSRPSIIVVRLYKMTSQVAKTLDKMCMDFGHFCTENIDMHQ